MLSVFILIILFAVHASKAAHDLFYDMDKDGDGEISLKEFSDDMKAHAFQQIDADNDQVLVEKEWNIVESNSDSKTQIKLFENIDKNKDRRIVFLEFSGYADRGANIEEAFMGLDKDGSNSLAQDEITTRPMFKIITIKIK
jgi:Ca2+-binding EF-hand superfamily protein